MKIPHTRESRAFEEGQICDDCGLPEVKIEHWGDLVPAGYFGRFCLCCWGLRKDFFFRLGIPKPFGQPTAEKAA